MRDKLLPCCKTCYRILWEGESHTCPPKFLYSLDDGNTWQDFHTDNHRNAAESACKMEWYGGPRPLHIDTKVVLVRCHDSDEIKKFKVKCEVDIDAKAEEIDDRESH